MKKPLLLAGLLLMIVGGAGCVVIDVEKVQSCRPATAQPREATICEIDAIGRLDFDHARQSGYQRIAEREGLSDAAQVHLIKAAFERLEFEQAKMDVLLALVANPSFSPAGEAALLERLDRLAFEHNKRKILDAVGGQKA